MGAKKLNQEVIKVETRAERKKLRKWVKVLIGLSIFFGLSYGVLSLGAYAMGTLLNGDPIAVGADDTLKTASAERENGNTVTVNMDEDTALMTLNQMTHQKVKAEEKRGAVEMTKKNIKEMLIIVKDSDYINKDFMERMLEKWLEGDFNTIVTDHNAILDAQNGTIGEAYDYMSDQEEKAFVKEVFRD